jgi:hypothetical protein
MIFKEKSSEKTHPFFAFLRIGTASISCTGSRANEYASCEVEAVVKEMRVHVKRGLYSP